MPPISRIAATAAIVALLAGCSLLKAPSQGTSSPSSPSRQQPASPPAKAPGKPSPVGGLPPAPAGRVCDTQAAAWAVGKNATADVVEQARTRAGAHMARVVQQGQPVTLDLNEQRLNLITDSSGKIVAATCG